MAGKLEEAILAEANIISYYPMADIAVAKAEDKGPNALHGSYDADVFLGIRGLSGIAGGGVKFAEVTGLGQVLTVPFNIATVVLGNVTHEFCIRLNRVGDNNNAEVFNAHGFSGPQVHCVTVGSGIGFRLKKQSAEIMVTTTSNPITDTYKWHHVMITYNGTTAQIYIDGVPTGGATTVQTFSAGGTGAQTYGTAFARYCLCHGVFYGRALSLASAEAHYAAFLQDLKYPTGTIYFGIHNGFITTEEKLWTNQIKQSRRLHSQVSRTDLRWDLIQTTEGAAYDWSKYDLIISKLYEGGIKKVVMPCVYSPKWANGGESITNVPGASAVDAKFTTWLGKYETFIAAAIARYKIGGVGNPKGIEIYWEMWNEPNGFGFWNSTELTPQPNGALYGTFYKAIRAKIKSVDASAKVSFGVFTDWNNTSVSSVVSKQFIKDAVAVGGLTIDYASYHPYTQNFKNSPNDNTSATNYFDDALNMYDTLLGLGFTSVKMILSEFGWKTTEVSEALQAEYLKIALERIKNYWSNFVELALVFRDYDKSESLGLYKNMPESGTAEEKPSAGVFKSFAAPFDKSSNQSIPSTSIPSIPSIG